MLLNVFPSLVWPAQPKIELLYLKNTNGHKTKIRVNINSKKDFWEKPSIQTHSPRKDFEQCEPFLDEKKMSLNIML